MTQAQNKDFRFVSDFSPSGDQPKAIEGLVSGLEKKMPFQTLLGVTGSGKTYTMAQVINQTQRPALILAHNKTLAAQLYAEFKEFFPDNCVEYFVSYYDFYQPEAYLPASDTYIEKDASINEEIDRLRHSATRSVLSRRDTIIISSVSCIYGLGSPEEYQKIVIHLGVGQQIDRREMLRQLTDMQYARNDIDFRRGRFRVMGDVVDIYPAYGELAIKLELFGDEIEKIRTFDPLTGEYLENYQEIDIFPATHFVAKGNRLEKAIQSIESELADWIPQLKGDGYGYEAQRLEQRARFDIEMLRETGYCSGIENYSRHFDGRKPGEPPFVLLDYFPKDFLLFVDESHITIPQIGAMYAGDKARKDNLIRYGFRMPSARDNRPLKAEEFWQRISQGIFVSATPTDYERSKSGQVVEQVVRPTGLVDPEIEVRPAETQVEDLLKEIRIRVKKRQRVLVTTMTKKFAEDLADFLLENKVKTNYLHSDVKTMDRVEILRDLRLGEYDVIVGINLLREGLDLPEVTLVAILDADKEGYLRSETALIQTVGRAARNVEGRVIMYGRRITRSMQAAIDETDRRRAIQVAHNKKHNITPETISKRINDNLFNNNGPEQAPISKKARFDEATIAQMSKEEKVLLIKQLEKDMQAAAQRLEFEEAALLRDQIGKLRGEKN